MENKQTPAPEQAPEIKEGFFLRRPIFSTVISLIITLVGAIAISVLPVEQYPDLTPPQVEVNATYTGASANVIAETVASLLESQINGVDNMIYMNSVSSGTGSMSLTVSFNVGTDPDQATIDVNNRVQLALAQLPQEVQRMGVSVLKKSSSMLQIIFLTSPDQRYNTIYLSNYALLNIVDELKRLPGVGDAKNFAAQDYSMRVWLKPDVMSQLGVTPEDIATALRDQNAQFAAGRMGAEPMSPGVGVTWQITTQGRLTTPEQFGDVILRTQPDGSILRLKDVATIELGAQSYDFVGKYNGLDAVPIGIYLSPGANALATAEVVKAKMEELSKEFPVGVAYSIPYDTTTFVKISIEEVVKTLFEAMVLVFLVVYLFLQNWRATLIPCLAVPVSIVGTFAGMYALGFSINTLTMFGLVACHRHRGRRRHRRARERGAAHQRRAAAAQGDRQGHAGSDGPGYRHRAGAVRRVHPRGLHRRHGGPHVPAVRHHHRGVRGHLGRGGPDLHSRPVRPAAQAGARGAQRFLPQIQRMV